MLTLRDYFSVLQLFIKVQRVKVNKLLILLVFGISISTFAQEDFKINYITERVSLQTETKMQKGSSYIIKFYESINFSIEISNINLRVFSSYDDYKSHQEINSNARSDNGYFSISKQEIVLFNNERIMKTFYHEFNHYLLRAHFMNPPKWINEGLSEFFEYLKDTEPISILPQKKKITRIRNWIDDEIENDIKQVLSSSNRQWTEQNINPEYQSSTISYAIVFFLMSLENNEQILEKIIHKLMSEELSQDVLNESYPGSFAKFIKDFIKFYKQYNC